MKFRKLFVLALMMAIFTCFATSAQNSDKITQAVMKVYNDHLIKNPNDYNTLFMRANQLFYNKSPYTNLPQSPSRWFVFSI